MYDQNVERNALCSIINDFPSGQMAIHTLRINADYFHLEPHAVIFEAIIDLAMDKKPIDFETVWQEVSIKANYMQYDDIATIQASKQARPYYWLELLQKYYFARQIQQVFKRSEAQLKNPAGVYDVLSMATEDLFHMQMEMAKADDSVRIEDVMDNVGLIPSKYTRINDVIVGYACGRPTVIGARPKVGKTTFAICEVLHKILTPDGNGWYKYNMHSTIFSLEMTRAEIIRKMVCIQSGIPEEIVRRKMMNKEQTEKFRAFFDLISRAPLMIYDRPHTPKQLCTNMRYQSERNNTKFIVADFFQRMRSKGRKDREFFSIASNDIADTLKNLQSDPAMLVFSQLNRNADMDLSKNSRYRNVPKPSDLKETGSLEEDAYTVGLMYWDPQHAHLKFGPDDPNWIQPTVINWCLNRGGASGESNLQFYKRRGFFRDE